MKETSDGTPRWIATPVTLHAVQCAQCMKWRIIPTKEQYEAIREHLLEEPWICESASNWRSELHCDLPADIQQDRRMVWAIDKPNPSAPAGWERQITVRTDGSSKFADVYYTSPLGTKLRSKIQVEKYIAKHPDSVPPETTMDQFSFAVPRPLPGVCPQLTPNGGHLSSSQTAKKEHAEQRQATAQSADKVQGDDLAASPHASTQPLPSEQDSLVSGDGRSEQLRQVTQILPHTTKQRPLSSKRRNPVLPPKQDVKKERLSKESVVMSVSDQLCPGVSTSSITTE